MSVFILTTSIALFINFPLESSTSLNLIFFQLQQSFPHLTLLAPNRRINTSSSMFRLYRHIRQILLLEGKVSRYLGYAVGRDVRHAYLVGEMLIRLENTSLRYTEAQRICIQLSCFYNSSFS